MLIPQQGNPEADALANELWQALGKPGQPPHTWGGVLCGLLGRGIPTEGVQHAIRYLAAHRGERYLPRVTSATEFVKKYEAIAQLAGPIVVPSLAAMAIAHRVSSMHVTAPAVDVAVMAEQGMEWVNRLVSNPPPTSTPNLHAFWKYLVSYIPPAHIVVEQLLHYHAEPVNWQHRGLVQLGTRRAIAWAGDTSPWYRLKEYYENHCDSTRPK